MATASIKPPRLARRTLLLVLYGLLSSCAHPSPLPSESLLIPIRIATWNILFLNLDLPRVAADVLASGADVVLMQEVTEEARGALDPILSDRYPYRRWGGEFGLVSRLPIAWDVSIPGEYRRRGVQIAGIELGSATEPFLIVLANVHLEPQILERPDPAAVTNVLMRTERTHVDEIANVLRRLDRRFPHIIAGDFNSLPAFATRKLLLKKGYLDAASEVSWWPPATWSDDAIFGIPASLRIDYLFVNGGLKPVAMQARDSPASDHHLLIFDLLAPIAEPSGAGRGVR